MDVYLGIKYYRLFVCKMIQVDFEGSIRVERIWDFRDQSLFRQVVVMFVFEVIGRLGSEVVVEIVYVVGYVIDIGV